jgi:hypothetical protein
VNDQTSYSFPWDQCTKRHDFIKTLFLAVSLEYNTLSLLYRLRTSSTLKSVCWVRGTSCSWKKYSQGKRVWPSPVCIECWNRNSSVLFVLFLYSRVGEANKQSMIIHFTTLGNTWHLPLHLLSIGLVVQVRFVWDFYNLL